MIDEELDAAIKAKLDGEEAAGRLRPVTNPKVLAELARIIEDAGFRRCSASHRTEKR